MQSGFVDNLQNNHLKQAFLLPLVTAELEPALKKVISALECHTNANISGSTNRTQHVVLYLLQMD